MPAVSVDNAVANALGQRLGQPPPPAAPATANLPPPSARPESDPDDRDLLLKSANRPRFTESLGVRIRAFLEDAENFLEVWVFARPLGPLFHLVARRERSRTSTLFLIFW